MEPEAVSPTTSPTVETVIGDAPARGSEPVPTDETTSPTAEEAIDAPKEAKE
jgi:hypothetical protein